MFGFRLVIEGNPFLISLFPQFYVTNMVLHLLWSPDMYCLTTVNS